MRFALFGYMGCEDAEPSGFFIGLYKRREDVLQASAKAGKEYYEVLDVEDKTWSKWKGTGLDVYTWEAENLVGRYIPTMAEDK